jgi:hypothetical protein
MKRFGTLVLVSLMAVAASLFIWRDALADWYKLRGYEPPTEIVQLANDIGLDESPRRLFYVNHPVVTDATTFNEHCRDNEYTIVLGCYISGQNGIYLLNVTDERLNGVKQVTAAHEFLHAAYDRLNGDEKQRIDSLLSSAYNESANTRVRETVELYRKQDPSVVPNEMHSILGTEVRNLPEELEEYYARYFSDRSKIVDFSEQYEQAFTERRNLIRDYDAQLLQLKTKIDNLSIQLKITDQELRDQRTLMNQLRADGQTTAYNAQVSNYNSKVNKYNRDIDTLSTFIVQYNDIVGKRNSIAAEEAELVKAIDSRDVVPEQQ